MNTAYDVIDDFHGQYDKLVVLLEHLGYVLSGGIYRHPSRPAIVVGDLLDRGPKQVATMELVRAMLGSGVRRLHRKPGNFNQHRAFLEQVGQWSARDRGFVAWFRTLPLGLDVPGLRIVHACWHDEWVEKLRGVLGCGEMLTAGIAFPDKEGKVRQEVRVKWW